MPKTPAAPLDHLEAEATAPSDDISVTLDGVELHVLPIKKWKASGLRALRENDIDSWAEKCLAPGSYAEWSKIDPDLGQCEDFFTSWQAATGESRPK